MLSSRLPDHRVSHRLQVNFDMDACRLQGMADAGSKDEFKNKQLPIELEALPALKVTRPSHENDRSMGHLNSLTGLGLSGPLSSPGAEDPLALMFPDSSMIGTAAATNDPFHQIFGRVDGLAPSPAHLTMPLSALATSRGGADFRACFQETLMQNSRIESEPQQQPSPEQQIEAARRFVRQVDELEKRAQTLWETENFELERGAMLRVLGGSGAGTKPIAPKPASHQSSLLNSMPPPPPQMPRMTAGIMLQPMSATATEGLMGAASPSQSDILGFISFHGINNSPSSLSFDLVHAEVRLLGAQGTPTKANRGDAMEVDEIQQRL